MKIVFLDFDGVLNNENYRNTVEDYYEEFVDESRLYLLKYIIEQTEARIVLTTTWRMYWDVEERKCSQEGIKSIKFLINMG